MPNVKIEIEGLAEWRKQIKAIDKDLVKELGQAYKAIATFIVADATAKATGLGGVAAHSAQALTATARSTDVSVKLNGDKYPWSLGGEFGGGPPRTPQFKAWRGNGADAGYFLYPTIHADAQKILDAYAEAFDKVTKLAYPNN